MKKPLPEIEAELYEVLADKTFTEGARVDFWFHNGHMWHNEGGGEEYSDRHSYGIVRNTDGGLSVMPIDSGFSEFDLSEDDFTGGEYVFDDADRVEATLIGHEPTLNDVLLKTKGDWCDPSIEYWSDEGKWSIRIRPYGHRIIDIPYDLTKSFDSQTEETKRKLHSLICVK